MAKKKQQQETETLIGRVHQLVPDRGFGFIVTEDFRKFFFHAQDVDGQELPEVGSRVSFSWIKNEVEGRHDTAVNIHIISRPGKAGAKAWGNERLSRS